jgi:hypothetical protein
MKIPQKDNRLLLHFVNCDQSFERIVGRRSCAFCSIDQAINRAPDNQIVFEFFGDGFKFPICTGSA